MGSSGGGRIRILAPEHSSFCCILRRPGWSQLLANEIPEGQCRWPVYSRYYGVHFSLEFHNSDKNGIEGHLGQNNSDIPFVGKVSKLWSAAGAAESKWEARQDSIRGFSSDSEGPQGPQKWHIFWFRKAVCSGGPDKGRRIPFLSEQVSCAGWMA